MTWRRCSTSSASSSRTRAWCGLACRLIVRRAGRLVVCGDPGPVRVEEALEAGDDGSGLRVAILDRSVVGVALPPTQRSLGGGFVGQRCVGQCVPVDARLDGPARRVSGRYRPAASGDCGRGRGFDAASLQCALAPSIAVSIAFRALERITGASHPELGGGDHRDFPKQPARPSDRLVPRIASLVRRSNARSACSLDCRSTHPRRRRRRCREDDSRSCRQPPAWGWLTPWSRPPATRPGPHSRSRAAPVGAGCAR